MEIYVIDIPFYKHETMGDDPLVHEIKKNVAGFHIAWLHRLNRDCFPLLDGWIHAPPWSLETHSMTMTQEISHQRD